MVVPLMFLVVSLCLGQGRCTRICKLVVACVPLFSAFLPLFSVLFLFCFCQIDVVFCCSSLQSFFCSVASAPLVCILLLLPCCVLALSLDRQCLGSAFMRAAPETALTREPSLISVV